MQALFLFLSLAVSLCRAASNDCGNDDFWKTKLKDYFTIDCGSGSIQTIRSCHCGFRGDYLSEGDEGLDECRDSWSIFDTKVEDRRFTITCATGAPGSILDLEQDYHICGGNQYDKDQYCECPADMAIKGIQSSFSQDHRDRTYILVCAKLLREFVVTSKCEKSDWSEMDSKGSWSLAISDDYVLVGMYSRHDNHKEDRSFSFKWCAYCGRPFWGEWGEWSSCSLCTRSGADKNAVQMRERVCFHEQPYFDVDECNCPGSTTESRQCTCRSATTDAFGNTEALPTDAAGIGEFANTEEGAAIGGYGVLPIPGSFSDGGTSITAKAVAIALLIALLCFCGALAIACAVYKRDQMLKTNVTDEEKIADALEVGRYH